MALAWAMCGIFAIVDLTWLTLSHATFAPGNFYRAGAAILGLGAIYYVALAVSRRIGADRSRMARLILHIGRGLQCFIRAVVFMVVFAVVGATFTYLGTSAGLPLQDARLADLDRSLGFDWLGFLTLTNSNPVLSSILVWSYHSAGLQLWAMYLLLSFSNREERLAEFLGLLAVTSFMCAALMALVPAAGAYAYYEPARHLFNNFSTNAGMWHYELFQYLRTETAPHFDFYKVEGLVTFPSFHTALAIITAYAVRDVPYVARPALLLNLIVIVSTLPEGGHHLVDVIAGAAVAGAAILVVRLNQAGWSLSWLKRTYPPVGPVAPKPET